MLLVALVLLAIYLLTTSITVMWLPVTITQFGLSNGAPVTG